MASQASTEARYVLRWQRGAKARREKDELAAEEPLEIQVDTRPVAVTMRTPGHDDELAAGFLLTEGIVRSKTDIAKITPYVRNQTGNVLDVFLAPHVKVDFAQLTRHVFASSSCGLCGKATIEAVHRQFNRVKTRLTVPAGTLLNLPRQLRAHQQTFERTGGL